MSRYVDVWFITNFGRPFAVKLGRREAIKCVEGEVGEPWRKARAYMEITKRRIAPVRRSRP